MPFTPSELALWLRSSENLDAVCTLLTSGDLRLVDYPGGGLTVLRSHSNDILRLEIGSAPILPPARD
jgi:hypothetical protein